MREVGRGRTRDPRLSAKTRMKPRITLITLGVDDLHRSTPVLLALVLVACASQTQSRVADMAATPLNDLNVVHAEIPAVLVEAQKEPYSVPSDRSCASLEGGVRALDQVLGPDLDAPASASNPGPGRAPDRGREHPLQE